jgi:hypothetical protein
MFRRTVGLNVEACDVFLDQVLHKRDAKMLCAFGSQSALGGSRIHRADAWRAGAKVPTAIGILGSADGPVYPLKASANNRYLVDQNNTGREPDPATCDVRSLDATGAKQALDPAPRNERANRQTLTERI